MAALHVHHGLSRNADAWLEHCEAACRRLRRQGRPVVFSSRVLLDRPAPGDSVEAWARRARYRALRDMAIEAGADLVLLGHHRRDQAETFLLQALRGGGVAALSAMPRQVRRDGVSWARPWLDQPREAIEGYRRLHRLRPVDDESNRDPRFARSRLRVALWPALVGAFADAEAALADAARRAQDAASALAELATADLAHVAPDESLDISMWRSLSPARRGNALRAWLRRCCGSGVPASLADRLEAELQARGARRWPVPCGELRSYRGILRHAPQTATPSSARRAIEAATEAATAVEPVRIDGRTGGVQSFAAWRGTLVVEPATAGGIAAERVGRLVLRPRRPSDRFQAGPGRPPRSLKLQFQAAGVPAWDRDGPVVCDGERPVYVPGLGVDARAVAGPDVRQVTLRWIPH